MNRTLKISLALFLALQTTGCILGDSEDGSGSNNLSPNPAANPDSGVWNYSEFDPVSNTCNSDEIIDTQHGEFGLLNNGNGTFTVDPNDGSAQFTCLLDAGEFSCPNRAAADYDVDPTVDATVHIQVTAAGGFTGDRQMFGSQTANITCNGADCIAVADAVGASFPCQFEVDFVAAWKPL